MRHSPLVDSQFSEGETPAQSPLNSKLQRALNCLDIQLEEELIRYRRQRSGRSIAPSNALRRKQPPKLELMSLGETAPASPSQVPVSLSAHPDLPFEPVEPSFEPEESSQLAIVPPQPQTDTSEMAYPPQVESAHLADSTPPDDYLESSEELLRSLAREEAQVRVDRGFLESLATPLGVGSMLMLLLSSAMFGYVIMNPSSLSFVAGLFDRPPTPAAAPSASTNPDGSQAAIPNSPPLDKQEFVDLGLGNLTTLKSRGSAPASKAPKAAASPSASPQAAPSTAVQPSVVPQLPALNSSPKAPVQSAPTRSYSPPSASRNDTPAPARSYAPAPARSYSPPSRPYTPPVIQTAPLPPVSVPRSDSPPVSAPSPTQNGGYSYKVEIPYTGDRSLEDARKAAPDAYLRPDGKIQLGATGSEADAKARAQELQNQGIPAEVNQR
ncbi:SPOR domain-containing protein [Phormidesmis priestleyi]